MDKTPLTVLDLETTGISPYSSKITEIAAVTVIGGDIQKEFHSLINPEIHIPSFITRITGITDAMVQDSPTIEKALPKLDKFLGNNIIVAHNASFDMRFLRQNFFNQRLQFENNSLCTLKISRRAIREVPNWKLTTLSQYFNIAHENAHRAMTDVLATKDLLSILQSRLEKIQYHPIEKALEFQSMPYAKVYKLFQNNT